MSQDNLSGPDDTVKIKGFGSFKVRLRKAQTGRNPKNGETVQVPAKCIVAFKPSRQLAPSDPAD